MIKRIKRFCSSEEERKATLYTHREVMRWVEEEF
ncbi:hypothetical protein U7128_000042 [Bacillus phage KKP_4050]